MVDVWQGKEVMFETILFLSSCLEETRFPVLYNIGCFLEGVERGGRPCSWMLCFWHGSGCLHGSDVGVVDMDISIIIMANYGKLSCDQQVQLNFDFGGENRERSTFRSIHVIRLHITWRGRFPCFGQQHTEHSPTLDPQDSHSLLLESHNVLTPHKCLTKWPNNVFRKQWPNRKRQAIFEFTWNSWIRIFLGFRRDIR